MNTRHPDADILLEFVSGRLPTAAGLTVSAHCEGCDPCRRTLDAATELGGALLFSLPRSAMLGNWRKLDAPDVLSGPAVAPKWSSPAGFDMELPAALAGLGLKPRRPLGLGFWIADTNASPDHGWRSFLLVVPPKGEIPSHGHRGEEYVTVLEGGFSDGVDDFVAGDFVRSGEHTIHRLRAHAAGRCVCLIAVQAPLVWDRPWMGLARFWTGL